MALVFRTPLFKKISGKNLHLKKERCIFRINMITLAVLTLIWFIVSCVRINKVIKRKEIAFNPYEAETVWDFLGFVLGSSALLIAVIIICVLYLP